MSDVVWIAGVGASGGLGAALARRFAQGGFTVAITGRNRERLGQVRDDLARSGKVEQAAGDISDPSQAAELSARVAELGALKAAIFNAGNAVRGNLLELTPEAFESTWRGSTFAGFLFAREAVKLLLKSGGGSLLFTGATASIRGRGPFTAFASAKAGLRSVAQSAAREFGPQNIHVAHVIVDGGINGEQLRRNAPQFVAQAGEDGLLSPDAIAETYWQLHQQSRSAWTHELDLRPFKESF